MMAVLEEHPLKNSCMSVPCFLANKIQISPALSPCPLAPPPPPPHREERLAKTAILVLVSLPTHHPLAKFHEAGITMREDDVKTVFSSKRTLRSELVKVKKRIDPSDRKGVIYEIECCCGHSYIGETGRTLNARIKEHQYAVRRYDPNNGKVHVNATMHNMKWEDARIVRVEQNTLKRNHYALQKRRGVNF